MNMSAVKFPVPEKFRRGSLRKDERKSVDSAERLLDLLDAEKPLAGASILDFGCGVKVVQALIERGDPHSFYLGLDVYREMIGWLQTALSNNPKYAFETVPFQNDMYNRDGQKMSTQSTLPGPSRKYDIICMFSVITHMSREDTIAILNILNKLIEDDGILVFSAFVSADQEPDHLDEVPDRPLLRSRFSRPFLDGLLRDAGWNIKQVNEPIKGLIQHHYVCTKRAR